MTNLAPTTESSAYTLIAENDVYVECNNVGNIYISNRKVYWGSFQHATKALGLLNHDNFVEHFKY